MSDNDLDVDAELLALAGDGSDDEDEASPPNEGLAERSPSQEAKPSVEKADEPVGNRKGVAQKVRARRRKRKQESEEEEDEGLGEG